MSSEGYDPKQISLTTILPQMGKKVKVQNRKMSVAEKAKKKLRTTFLRSKAKANAKAKAKAEKKPKQEEDVVEDAEQLEEVAEPEEKWEDSQR